MGPTGRVALVERLHRMLRCPCSLGFRVYCLLACLLGILQGFGGQ